MNDELRRALNPSSSMTSLDLEVFLPDLQGKSEIITDVIRKVSRIKTIKPNVLKYILLKKKVHSKNNHTLLFILVSTIHKFYRHCLIKKIHVMEQIM